MDESPVIHEGSRGQVNDDRRSVYDQSGISRHRQAAGICNLLVLWQMLDYEVAAALGYNGGCSSL